MLGATPLLLAHSLRDLLRDLGPSLPDVQQWWQAAAMLACVVAASAWLTARWLIRRRSGCAGDCSRCVAGGARTTSPGGAGPGACGHNHDGKGIRSAGLKVLPGSANLPPTGGV